MTLALLALAALAEPSCLAHPWEMHAIVTEADRASRRHSLPVGLLVAVVLAESGGRSIISNRRKCGGRDYGAAQIHDHDPSRRRLALLLTLSTNLDRAGQLLASSRARCARHPRWAACRRSEWALYNSASTRWAPRVLRIWRRLLERLAGRGVA